MEGDARSLGQLAAGSRGLLRHILLWLSDMKGLEVSVLGQQTLVPALHPRGLPSLEVESPRTSTQPLCRASLALSLLLLPSQDRRLDVQIPLP